MLRSSKNCKATNKKIKEGTLIKVSMSPNIRVRIQDKEYGHLQDISWMGEPIVGVVTKTWGSGHGIREIEMLSSGEFLLITTNNGLLDLEVLGC